MDILEYWWALDTQQKIDGLRKSLDDTRAGASATTKRQSELIVLLQQENDDLRLRLAVLIRLLVEQGTISKEQFFAAVTDAKTSVAASREQALAEVRARAQASGKRPLGRAPVAKRIAKTK